MEHITKIFENLTGLLTSRSFPKKKQFSTDSNLEFLQKQYVEDKIVIRFYNDFEELGDNRDEFNNKQKLFLSALFEQAICHHFCVVPINSWSIFGGPIYLGQSDDDDDEGTYFPFFSIGTPKYKINLYDYMSEWININTFKTTIASVILFGIASAFKNISENGYSYYDLSPRNIYLEKKEIKLKDDDEIIEIFIPLIGELGLVKKRDYKNPLTLIPEKISTTSEPQIIKFIVSLYLLFQPVNEEGNKKSIIADFYDLDANSLPKDFIFDDDINSKIIGNPQLFIDNPDLFVFDDRTDVLEAFLDLMNSENVNKAKPENQAEQNTNSEEDPSNQSIISSDSIFTSMNSTGEVVNIKTINKAISSIRSHKETNQSLEKSIQSNILMYFPLLAVAYASGDLESYPNLCHAAYYANFADYITASKLPTSVLSFIPNTIYSSDAERLFHEGEVLEGNAYAFSERQSDYKKQINDILSKAASKYKESAKLGFDKAKTRLAMLIMNDKSSSTEKKQNAFERLLLPATKTDPLAMFEVGMHYMNENDFEKSLYYLEKAYSNNQPDSVFQLARLYHKIAIDKANKDNAKDEIFKNLKKSYQYYKIAAGLYDNKKAATMKNKIDLFLSKNDV